MSNDHPENAEAAEAAAAAETGETAPCPPRQPKKKKRKKRSRDLRELERMERHLSRAASRLSSAVAAGVSRYEKERDRSAVKKRDGAVLDMPRNTARGLAVTMREASEVPVDLVDAMDSRLARRALRLGARVVLWPLRR